MLHCSSPVCGAQEVSLIDSWRADSQSFSMALARNYPMLQNWNGLPAFCQLSLFDEGLLPIFAMIFGAALQRSGLQSKLRLTRLVLVGLRPAWPSVRWRGLPGRCRAFLMASTLTPPVVTLARAMTISVPPVNATWC